jgi:hypothetical protein
MQSLHSQSAGWGNFLEKVNLILLRRMIADLEFAPSNRQLVDYWLSLCQDDKLPDRSAFRPADVRPLLANLVIYDVVPGKSVTVRLAGTTFNIALGLELKGRDWVKLAPENHRPQRLRGFTDIAMGAIGRGLRRVEMLPTGYYTFEGIMLPCHADRNSDVHPVVGHIDWNPGREFVKIKSPEQALGAPLVSFEVIPLPALRVG